MSWERLAGAALVASCAVGGSGCGSESASKPAPPDPRRPIKVSEGTAVPRPLSGRYEHRLAKKDVAGKGRTATGKWQLLLEGKRYEIITPSGDSTTGVAAWRYNRVTFSRDKDCIQFNRKFGGPSTYRWQKDGRSLTFFYLAQRDVCDPRGPALTAKPWKETQQIPSAPSEATDRDAR